jgi:hypothetical protein
MPENPYEPPTEGDHSLWLYHSPVRRALRSSARWFVVTAGVVASINFVLVVLGARADELGPLQGVFVFGNILAWPLFRLALEAIENDQHPVLCLLEIVLVVSSIVSHAAIAAVAGFVFRLCVPPSRS